ncbi:hypothetical protein D3C80_2115950 [compost metagenome]
MFTIDMFLTANFFIRKYVIIVDSTKFFIFIFITLSSIAKLICSISNVLIRVTPFNGGCIIIFAVIIIFIHPKFISWLVFNV